MAPNFFAKLARRRGSLIGRVLLFENLLLVFIYLFVYLFIYFHEFQKNEGRFHYFTLTLR